MINTLCPFGIKVTRTRLSCRSTFDAYVMKVFHLIWIRASQHMLHRINVCLIDVICVLQKNYLLQDLTIEFWILRSLRKRPIKQNQGQSHQTPVGGLNNSRSAISLKTSCIQLILSWRCFNQYHLIRWLIR